VTFLFMQIVGGGMIAQAFARAADQMPGVLLFASGLSRSSQSVDSEMQREASLLYEMLRKTRADGRRIVYFSTASPHLYGTRRAACPEDGPIYPCTAYGRHKAAMEAVIRASGADYLILRLSEVVGPQQRSHQLLPALARQVASGVVTVYRGAERDLIDVADVVKTSMELFARSGRAGIVNIASGHPVPAEKIIDHLIGLSGRQVVKTYVEAAADCCLVSTARLLLRAPVASRLGFSPVYYQAVIDRYYGIDWVLRDTVGQLETGFSAP
jgi:nucleoside-diphosphate-sugar epimerase